MNRCFVKSLLILKPPSFVSYFHLCGVLFLLELQSVLNGCGDFEDILWDHISAKLQGEKVKSKF